jgi:hypothetical protein
MRKLIVLSVICVAAPFAAIGAGQGAAAVQEEQPVWIWGLPSSYGEYPEEYLAEANEWANEMFGATFRITGLPDGSTAIQSLNLLMAEGEFPCAVNLSGSGGMEGVAIKTLIESLIEQGKIQSVDRYFNDPELEMLYNADRDYLKAYTFNGEIYAFPGYTWKINKDDAALSDPYYFIRMDVAEAMGGPEAFPKSSGDFHEYLQRIDAAGFVGEDGNPIWAASLAPDDELANLTGFLKQLKGAGWQVDSELNYGPFWGSEEMHESLQLVNTMWSEGLIDPALFTIPEEAFRQRLIDVRAGIGIGQSGYSNLAASQVLYKLVNQHGTDSPQANAFRPKMYVMMYHPMLEEDGKVGVFYPGLANPWVVSSDCQNPDAFAKLHNFAASPEGILTTRAGVGFEGVDWRWVDRDSLEWIRIDAEAGEEYLRTYLLGTYRPPEDVEKDGLPQVIPGIPYVGTPSKSNYYEWAYSNGWIDDRWGKHRQPMGRLTGSEYNFLHTGAGWEEGTLAYTSARPSYVNFIPRLDPRSENALVTVMQRWTEGLPGLISADASDFESAYAAFLGTLLEIADWGPIYETLNQQWREWMDANGDDTAELHKIEWRPEVKQEMGW